MKVPSLKKKKEFDKCFSCQKELTGKISLVEGNKYCFRCFVIWRIADRAQQAKQEKEWIGDWIRTKKYFCKTCKLRKCDTDCTFSCIGVICMICGKVVDTLNVKLPKQMQYNLE